MGLAASSATGPKSTCPYCGSPVAVDEDCQACGATVADRVLWATVQDLGLAKAGSRFLHHMPSAPVARRFYALLGANYVATLAPGTAAPCTDVPFHSLDPVHEATALQAGSFDLIAIAQGLRAADAAAPAVLAALAAALAPGGSLLFGGDIVDENGRMTGTAAGAPDDAGRVAFATLVRRQFGRECRIRPGLQLRDNAVEAAGISAGLLRRVTPRTLFWYQH
jgi:hypothetical protein